LVISKPRTSINEGHAYNTTLLGLLMSCGVQILTNLF